VDQQPSAFEPASATEPIPPAAPAPSQPVAPARPAVRARGATILNGVLAVAVALAIGGVAFAAGRLTAPAAAAGAFGNGGPGQFFGNGNGNGNGGNRGNGQGAAGGFLAGGGITLEGTVESIDATTLTLKTASGQTIQIALGGTTTYHAQSDASASDVTTGKTVLVRLDGRGGFRGGPQSTAGTGGGTASSATASDVTVVP
jgi:hypothetical protein